MKAIDIVAQLAVRLPMFSDKFTTNVSITSLTRSGSTATADTASAHGLAVGSQTNIVGAESPITISSLTRVGTVGTLVTATDHDLTKFITGTQLVSISGAVEVEFNGDFTLLAVANRTTITFTMADSGATTATGTPLLLNGSSYLQAWNGLFSVVSVPTTTQFTYTLATLPPLTTATGTISARSLPRISSGISVERILQAYTKGESIDDVWAFVVLGDVIASKNRAIDSDAVDNLQRGNEYRQQLIYPFDVLTLVPASSTIAAREARDLAEDIFRPLCQSLLFSKFDSNLYVGAQNPVIFVDHGFAFYNSATYGHTYAFQAVADLTFDDTVGYDDDVAFRDVTVNMGIDIGTQVDKLTADINLDDE